MHRPHILITPSLNDTENCLMMNRVYYDSILRAGGLPVLMPLTGDPAVLDAYLDMADGVLFSGGSDVHPCRYGEEVHPQCGNIHPLRDTLEFNLLERLFSVSPKPILCICRGIQVLNAALGGTLYQDIPSEYPGFVFSHSQSEHEFGHAHTVSVADGTLLSGIVGCSSLSVNSLHHQGIRTMAPPLRVCAVSEDGLIEAVDHPGYGFCLGVQWHPERLSDHDTASQRLFDAFCQACSDMKA